LEITMNLKQELSHERDQRASVLDAPTVSERLARAGMVEPLA